MESTFTHIPSSFIRIIDCLMCRVLRDQQALRVSGASPARLDFRDRRELRERTDDRDIRYQWRKYFLIEMLSRTITPTHAIPYDHLHSLYGSNESCTLIMFYESRTIYAIDTIF